MWPSRDLENIIIACRVSLTGYQGTGRAVEQRIPGPRLPGNFPPSSAPDSHSHVLCLSWQPGRPNMSGCGPGLRLRGNPSNRQTGGLAFHQVKQPVRNRDVQRSRGHALDPGSLLFGDGLVGVGSESFLPISPQVLRRPMHV